MNRKIMLFLMALLPLAVMADTYDTTIDGITYSINMDTKKAYAKTITTSNGRVTVKSSVKYQDKNYTVIGIGYEAAKGNTTITSVSLPSTLTYINDGAFKGCTKLVSVNIPAGVKLYGTTFYGCTSLKSVVIPYGVTYNDNIFGGADFAQSGLESVTIDSEIVREGLFHSCYSLKNVTFGNHVKYIEASVFYYCNSLEKITLPDGLTTICNNLFQSCTNLRSVTIPSIVTSIGNNAFYGCKNLTTINLPENLKTIGGYAFYDCSSLPTITIPNKVTSIGDKAFEGCTGLTSVTLYCDTIQNWFSKNSSSL